MTSHFYTGALEGDFDPETDTLHLKLQEVSPQKRFIDSIFNLMQRNREYSIKPMYTASHAIIYKDDGTETKYWDVGMPVKGTGAQILARVDFKKREV